MLRRSERRPYLYYDDYDGLQMPMFISQGTMVIVGTLVYSKYCFNCTMEMLPTKDIDFHQNFCPKESHIN